MARIFMVFPAIALNLVATCAIAQSTDVIKTNFGPVQGEILTTVGNAVPYSSFKGIPYAKPPTMGLRFQPPKLPDPWTDVMSATTPGSACPQMSRGLTTKFSYIGDEDCLYINIFSPVTELSKSPVELKAVMFWIHGGGFTSGSSDPDYYGPDFLIENDVVVVTFNYRLGALGFLAMNDPGAKGNVGLRDQNLALVWTSHNIDKFGGDPSRITIIGQGAGGASVLYHSLSHMSQGLFSGVIAMSGSPVNPWAFQPSKEALNNAFELGKNLGGIAVNKDDLLDKLRSEDAENIVTTTFETLPISSFLPVVEDLNITDPDARRFLERCIIDSYEAGDFSQVPYILGFTRDENLLFFENEETISVLLNMSKTVAENCNSEFAVPSVYNVNMGDDNWSRALIKETSDLLYKSGIEHARSYISTYSPQPVYYYRVSYSEPGNALHYFHGITETGTADGDDLVYLWWIKDADMPLDHTATISIIRSTMTRLFTNFAKYGNPTPDGMNDPVLATQWPDYRMIPRHVEFDTETRVGGTNVNENTEAIIAACAPFLRGLKDCKI